MRSSYDAIVIGSGFGGAVAACRLAQAGFKLAVLERGRRYDSNPFPRYWSNPSAWLWKFDQGLFDIRPLPHMTVVQAAGLGGGSLIYANVHLRPPEAVFENGWPGGYTRAMLDPYYDLVAYMLDINTIEKASQGLPRKTELMRTVAAKLGRTGQFCYPHLAVDFGPLATHKNKFGVDQRGCNYCGECDIGCNLHAKNTLDFNYLAVANANGADIATQAEVTRIEPCPDGYKVSFANHAAGGQKEETQAGLLFVCAGAVNTTELLLKCRNQYNTLPNISATLGHHYSGNGDFLAFAFNTAEPFKPSDGPTITTGIVYSREDAGGNHWFILEEGGYPKEIGKLLQLLNPQHNFPAATAILTMEELLKRIGSVTAAIDTAPDAASDHTAVFLAMGRDLANGVIKLNPITAELGIEWDVPANSPLYKTESQLVTDIAIAMGGDAAMNPLWRLLHIPVSVHNLGGCVMADSPAAGVTDANGQVYGYPGLFVLDGAALPAATGVNPSHTIAAVAERNVEAAIRRLKGISDWTAPEVKHCGKIVDPLADLSIPKGGTPPTNKQTIGISFTETMRGYVSKGWQPPDDYAGAERRGQDSNSRMEFTLTITMPDLDAFLASEEHAGIAIGNVVVDGFTPKAGSPVSSGVFNLFVGGNGPNSRKMLYALPFTGSDGKPYLLDGFKDVRDHGNFDVWGSTSTLYTVIRSGHERTGAVAATGIVKILMADFMKQLTTFRAIGTDNSAAEMEALERFGKMFFGSLWEVFVKPHLP